MPRSKRNVRRTKPNPRALTKAAGRMLNNQLTLRQAAMGYNVSKSTLCRHLKKHKASGNQDFIYSASNAVKRVFIDPQEAELNAYLKQCSNMHYGLSTNDVRQVAYNYAVANSISHPNSWEVYQKAGIDWFQYFLKRNRDLSLPPSPIHNPSPGLLASLNEILQCTSGIFTEKNHVIPEVIRPFPNAGSRKAAKNRGRKPGRCCHILTDTPEKHEIEELAAHKNRKDDRTKKKQTVKRKIALSISSSSSDDDQIELNESSQSEEEAPEAEIINDLKENDFILVKLATKKMSKFFVAKVMDISDNTVEIKCLKKTAANKFVDGDETVYEIDKMTEIVFKLPAPHVTGKTERRNREMTFYIDFSLYNKC
ncbi:hypothetical protein ILUMI_11272 [Ignelater luminosus]|uniref:HTH psq-type domain-containing protein n=1 Tax=Ignelater luminosus TaxID=2038154 RepID=A0A8K0G7W4_IGNLU|nr:hypothetical protein ILUMI_11272 [Ignelater luminosus]